MKRKPVILFILFFVLLIAYFTRDVVEKIIILPLAYFLWVLKLYYAAFPQFFFWAVLTGIVLYSAASNLIPEARPRKFAKTPRAIPQGEIERLLDVLQKTKDGNYHKWMIAHRLGKTVREALAERDGNSQGKKNIKLNSSAWKPPKEIRNYLEAGINGSFADFPRGKFGSPNPPTPLDIDLEEVLDYLEVEMEINNGHHKSI